MVSKPKNQVKAETIIRSLEWSKRRRKRRRKTQRAKSKEHLPMTKENCLKLSIKNIKNDNANDIGY